ncbi:hypothetical protein PPYR_08076 [Photinus pyralis]|uniref:Hcy-binding domain-containing protein n=1 Tax=Photinus pyralis TaxID=7054 RepID=A0A5N4AIB2_PHOPY|nr:homocysteine S-methyltransferase 1-like isoform X2 [Photinus pyralis]XP_031343996.1 homocysteine S-methyltransferase 1-like isoform X2 [Photinus pyralis]KAB0797070.1 hypothetical protein PPYR_08064 [Photinus pyralis]KAB0797082.1 hypothetical protein PPYR_08076 [Photinus pyralis]
MIHSLCDRKVKIILFQIMAPFNITNLNSDNIHVLDGGFATQLGCHIVDHIDGDPLWSARFLKTQPQAVIDTHLDFLRAGADVIMTNTYQASIPGFQKYLNLSAEEGYDLIKEAVNYAKIACDRFQEEFSDNSRLPLIVGSVGPYGASLHDGSEYTGAYGATTPIEVMREWHRPRIQALVDAGIRMLGIETIPCCVEAEMLVELIKEYPDVKAWVAFSCNHDGKCLVNGDNFQKAARKCYDLNPEQIVAVGVNCLAPKLVESLFKDFNVNRPKNPVPLIVYPNSGETYSVDLGWINRDKCESLVSYIPKWLDLGATWVGGCCRTYASDITRIKSEVMKWQHAQEQNRITENGSHKNNTNHL